MDFPKLVHGVADLVERLLRLGRRQTLAQPVNLVGPLLLHQQEPADIPFGVRELDDVGVAWLRRVADRARRRPAGLVELALGAGLRLRGQADRQVLVVDEVRVQLAACDHLVTLTPENLDESVGQRVDVLPDLRGAQEPVLDRLADNAASGGPRRCADRDILRPHAPAEFGFRDHRHQPVQPVVLLPARRGPGVSGDLVESLDAREVAEPLPEIIGHPGRGIRRTGRLPADGRAEHLLGAPDPTEVACDRPARTVGEIRQLQPCGAGVLDMGTAQNTTDGSQRHHAQRRVVRAHQPGCHRRKGAIARPHRVADALAVQVRYLPRRIDLPVHGVDESLNGVEFLVRQINQVRVPRGPAVLPPLHDPLKFLRPVRGVQNLVDRAERINIKLLPRLLYDRLSDTPGLRDIRSGRTPEFHRRVDLRQRRLGGACLGHRRLLRPRGRNQIPYVLNLGHFLRRPLRSGHRPVAPVGDLAVDVFEFCGNREITLRQVHRGPIGLDHAVIRVRRPVRQILDLRLLTERLADRLPLNRLALDDPRQLGLNRGRPSGRDARRVESAGDRPEPRNGERLVGERDVCQFDTARTPRQVDAGVGRVLGDERACRRRTPLGEFGESQIDLVQRHREIAGERAATPGFAESDTARGLREARPLADDLVGQVLADLANARVLGQLPGLPTEPERFVDQVAGLLAPDPVAVASRLDRATQLAGSLRCDLALNGDNARRAPGDPLARRLARLRRQPTRGLGGDALGRADRPAHECQGVGEDVDGEPADTGDEVV